jgi:hypothetical protein
MERLTIHGADKHHCKSGCKVGKECCFAGCVQFQKVQNKLSAYEDIELEPDEIVKIISNYEAFMCEMTGNQMSKCNYELQTVIAVANDYIQKEIDEALAEAKDTP